MCSLSGRTTKGAKVVSTTFFITWWWPKMGKIHKGCWCYGTHWSYIVGWYGILKKYSDFSIYYNEGCSGKRRLCQTDWIGGGGWSYFYFGSGLSLIRPTLLPISPGIHLSNSYTEGLKNRDLQYIERFKKRLGPVSTVNFLIAFCDNQVSQLFIESFCPQRNSFPYIHT